MWSPFHVVVGVLALIHSTVGHLCLITPRQRGDMNISKGGSHTCFRHGAPCGGIAPVFPPGIHLEGGLPIFIKWQQNYNHYTVGYPGYMDIAIATANEVAEMDLNTGHNMKSDPFRTLATVADKQEYDQAHQQNYTAVVTLPNMDCDHCVIRARYVAHKPGETIFYQCADVKVLASTPQRRLEKKGHLQLQNFPEISPKLPGLQESNSSGKSFSREARRGVAYRRRRPSLTSIITAGNDNDATSHAIRGKQDSGIITTNSSPLLPQTNGRDEEKEEEGPLLRTSSSNSNHPERMISSSVEGVSLKKALALTAIRYHYAGENPPAAASNIPALPPVNVDQTPPGPNSWNTASTRQQRLLQPVVDSEMDRERLLQPQPVVESEIMERETGLQTAQADEERMSTSSSAISKNRDDAEHGIKKGSWDQYVTARGRDSATKNYQQQQQQYTTGEEATLSQYGLPDKAQQQQQQVSGDLIYGMANSIDFPGGAHFLSFDTVTGERQEISQLPFRVDSPFFNKATIRSNPSYTNNASVDFVTDGVLTLDPREVAVMPMNRHGQMEAIADTIVEMDTRSGYVKTTYNISKRYVSKTSTLKSAFSAVVVEIESSYVTFNIEPDEEEDGKFNFIVGRLYVGGSWVMLSKTDQSEDTYVNFLWADYDISVKTLYVLLGNENDAFGLSARLYKFSVMPGPPPSPHGPDFYSFINIDVSQYPFMAFHLHPYHTNLLYAVSPGLHTTGTTSTTSLPSYHLVTLDVDMGTVKEVLQIAPPGIFERYYGGAVINGVNRLTNQLVHVLSVANTEADVIATIDLVKQTVSFSQVTNLRNVCSLYAR